GDLVIGWELGHELLGQVPDGGRLPVLQLLHVARMDPGEDGDQDACHGHHAERDQEPRPAPDRRLPHYQLRTGRGGHHPTAARAPLALDRHGSLPRSACPWPLAPPRSPRRAYFFNNRVTRIESS